MHTVYALEVILDNVLNGFVREAKFCGVEFSTCGIMYKKF